MVSILIFVAACAGPPPEVPLGTDGTADPVLLVGRDIFSGSCKRCHGSTGGGGVGPRLNSSDLDEDFPEVVDLVELISGGRKRMPSFSSSLTEAQIIAVARYVKEVL